MIDEHRIDHRAESRGPWMAPQTLSLPPWFTNPARWRSLTVDLLDGLSEKQRLEFYAECGTRTCDSVTEILSQGEEAPCAFLLIEGWVEVTFVDVDGNTVIAHVAGPGEVLGEVEILSGKTCAATCCAQPGSKMLVFNAALLMKHVPTSALLRNFAGILHGRLVRDNRLHAIAQFYPAEARICLHLLRLTTNERCEVQVSQAQIALLSGCSRQTVNRTLAQLRDQNIISISRGRVRVLDLARLSAKRHET